VRGGERCMPRRQDGVRGGVMAALVAWSWKRERQVRWTSCGRAWYVHEASVPTRCRERRRRPLYWIVLKCSPVHVPTCKELFLYEMFKPILMYHFNESGLRGI